MSTATLADDNSMASDFDCHHCMLLSQDQEEGWEAELHRYLKDLPPNVTKDTDVVQWWQVCIVYSFADYLIT
jgi:hypothetical protein